MGHPGQAPVPVWDAPAAGGGLAHHDACCPRDTGFFKIKVIFQVIVFSDFLQFQLLGMLMSIFSVLSI